MMSGGFFIGNNGATSTDNSPSDVRLEGNNIIYSPSDPIYIDGNSNVFYSIDKRNAYLYIDENGNTYARKVAN